MPKRAVPAEGRRINVNTKVTQEIRQKLEKAAAFSDRPLSSEIEFRLDQSFAHEAIIRSLTGSDIQSEMFMRLAEVVRESRKLCNSLEFDEIRTRRVIEAASIRVVTMYCWSGGNLPQKAYVGEHGKPVSFSDLPPEQVGIEVADNAMIWGSDPALAELDEAITEKWSADPNAAILRTKLAKHGSGTRP